MTKSKSEAKRIAVQTEEKKEILVQPKAAYAGSVKLAPGVALPLSNVVFIEGRDFYEFKPMPGVYFDADFFIEA